jgi:long-chain fatty acid transport protein
MNIALLHKTGHRKSVLKASVALVALVSMASGATAGGFAVREQSASLMGSAFAGAAAGVDLSSGYWNPASFGIAQEGLSSQSSYTAISANTEISNATTSLGGVIPFPIGGSTSTDIDKLGYLSSSYAAYRINDKMVLGAAITSPFGLATDSDDYTSQARLHGVAADMKTINLSAALTYEVAPGIHISAGPQIEFMKLKYWIGSFASPGATTALKIQDDFGIGYTAGILMKNASTSVGLGFRSKIEHDLDGNGNRIPGLGDAQVSASLETPEMITFSFVQALTQGMRAMGTVEWTNWSRLTDVPIFVTTPLGSAQLGTLDAGWDDGWFISGGLEYDYSPVLTVRGGVAWEKSPIQNADQRLTLLPDSDRIWTTVGASYKYSEATTIDFSYAHIFFEDSHLTRGTVAPSPVILDADVQNSADIISVGMRTKW